MLNQVWVAVDYEDCDGEDYDEDETESQVHLQVDLPGVRCCQSSRRGYHVRRGQASSFEGIL